eukprot:CAMPEP_0114656928 /NCGR_PEP_ID=MMETSP0191-20121206/13099_1 /TAXON_ID=126664 /ORGANISM="Sorites sp." /LENGTH=101 /DNA_ID=CAMNT_0001875163 /DNA_START=1660 /DNA_END=1962 /DNA_ORIENTATION=-
MKLNGNKSKSLNSTKKGRKDLKDIMTPTPGELSNYDEPDNEEQKNMRNPSDGDTDDESDVNEPESESGSDTNQCESDTDMKDIETPVTGNNSSNGTNGHAK